MENIPKLMSFQVTWVKLSVFGIPKRTLGKSWENATIASVFKRKFCSLFQYFLIKQSFEQVVFK